MADKGAADAAAVFDGLAEILDDPIPANELLEVGHLATSIVLARTKRGLDVEGRSFQRYSDAYAKRRARAGLATGAVDLVRKGHMLGALGPSVTGENEVSVQFASAAEARKASAHNFGEGRQPVREFMDVRSERELDVIGEALGEKWALRIEKKLER